MASVSPPGPLRRRRKRANTPDIVAMPGAIVVGARAIVGNMDLMLVPWMFLLFPSINLGQNAHAACPERCSCAVTHTQGVINCHDARLQHIPWDLPAPMEITTLDLSQNLINDINAQIIYPNLRVLDLSANRIFRIAPDRLEALTHLEVLNLRENDVQNLGTDTFSGLSHLKILDLSNNELKNLTSPVFRDLRNLERLLLTGNSIEEVSARGFDGLVSLEHLDLGDNRIPSISANMFSRLVSLRTLTLKYNRLEGVPSAAFTSLPVLQELVLESNGITVISADAFSSASSRGSELHVLNLKNNGLQNVPSEAISRLASLETLDLSQNPISKINHGAFSGLGSLRTLQLSSMPLLRTVYNGAFSDLAGLQHLEMNSNPRLSVIETNAFPLIEDLRILDLHTNALETLSESLVDWTSLTFLDLRYNQWRCDCSLAWMPRTLNLLATNLSLHILRDIKCSSPSELAGQRLVGLQDAAVTAKCLAPGVDSAPDQPVFQDHIMIAIMASIGSILIIIIIILVCKYGKSYSTAYAPAMDQYLCKPDRHKSRDKQCHKVPEIESDMSMSRNLRSSLSSSTAEIGVQRPKRKLTRVRFAESDQT